MNNPKISLIIVYNNENNLYDCIQSSMQQSFTNMEIICVNNGSKDNAENIAKEQAEKIDRIKLLSLPNGIDFQSAKRAGLSIAQGEFIIFIENNEIVTPDFIRNAYLDLQENNNIEIKNNYLYRRTFIENDRDVSSLVEDKVKKELSHYAEYTEDLRQKILIEFDKFNRNNTDTLSNSTYDIIQRFNALEKEFYNKDWKNQERMKILENSMKSLIEKNFTQIQNEIRKTYDFVNSELNKLKIEFKQNLNDNNKITDQKIRREVDNKKNENDEINENLKKLEKEIIFRYVNLKRIMDFQFDEIEKRLNGG